MRDVKLETLHVGALIQEVYVVPTVSKVYRVVLCNVCQRDDAHLRLPVDATCFRELFSMFSNQHTSVARKTLSVSLPDGGSATYKREEVHVLLDMGTDSMTASLVLPEGLKIDFVTMEAALTFAVRHQVPLKIDSKQWFAEIDEEPDSAKEQTLH